jgi:hypothetical protein
MNVGTLCSGVGMFELAASYIFETIKKIKE